MKRFVWCLACLTPVATSLNAHAQESPTDRGVYSLSGTIAYNESLSGGDFNWRVTFAPSAMYFVARDLAVGLSVDYSHQSNDRVDEDSYALGPAIRWYLPIDDIKPFVSGALGYGKIEADFNDGNNGSDVDYWTANLALGIDVFLARNVALETTIGYLYRDFGDDDLILRDTSSSSLIFHIGINVFVF